MGIVGSQLRGKGFGVFVDGMVEAFRRRWHVEWIGFGFGLALCFDVVLSLVL